MGAHAYILLNVQISKAEAIVKRLREIKGVNVVRELFGPYDVVVEIEEDSTVDITSVIRSKVKTVSGIVGLSSCVWADSLGNQAGGE